MGHLTSLLVIPAAALGAFLIGRLVGALYYRWRVQSQPPKV